MRARAWSFIQYKQLHSVYLILNEIKWDWNVLLAKDKTSPLVNKQIKDTIQAVSLPVLPAYAYSAVMQIIHG